MARHVQPEQARDVIVVLIPVWLAMIGLMTAGLPGALLLRVAASLERLVSSAELGGDQVWTAALLISAVGPFTLIPAHFILRRACRLPQWQHATMAGILALVVTVAASAVGIVLSGR